MKSITACATISKLRHVSSQFGVPNVIVSDNGSAFTSSKLYDLCRENSIQHVRSPPFHSQSNGQVERFLETFKRALLKLKGERTTREIIETFLLSYRATPNVNVPHSSSYTSPVMRAVAGYAGVGNVLSDRAEASLLDRIPVDSRFCVVRLAKSVRI
ncbi:hypothetical protein T265_08531 [Opisthorchis viverrini]|uniref:Integrase catalytic domain-containing protein n=1 Tax=Opisthorchis viverrini TaxID=6198 RepID=A0A074ZDB3_OPIVI|nr:hypothetical protein T265_08531 [Opisthorchis viverrini]KER23637.1 hypothetical protein T265_08531 [Opisthorchis viverrini]